MSVKIDLDTLRPDQLRRLVEHLSSHVDAIVVCNNELIRRLSPMPEPVAGIFNEWSRCLNAVHEASDRKVAEICETHGHHDRGSVQ